MALMFAICSPQPNWMPRNPNDMFQICQKLSRGFSTMSLSWELASSPEHGGRLWAGAPADPRDPSSRSPSG